MATVESGVLLLVKGQPESNGSWSVQEELLGNGMLWHQTQ